MSVLTGPVKGKGGVSERAEAVRELMPGSGLLNGPTRNTWCSEGISNNWFLIWELKHVLKVRAASGKSVRE